jgi:serine-type D-Ala-D-Ala carboxypeptidase/endopeptidase (penicillin-binding protein 4)
MRLTRRGVLAGLIGGVAQMALAEAPTTSLFPVPRGGKPRVAQPTAALLIADADLTGIVTYVVADAATGRVIEADGAETPVPPASVTKMITALYALEHLGQAYQFRTQVVATGPVVEGIVQGDLVLVGGGDPTLDTDRMVDLVARVARAGVRGVTGRFGVFAAALPRINQIDQDQPDFVSYNPTISGMNLNFNRVHFSWRRREGGYALDMDARSETVIPPVTIAVMQVVDRDLPLFTYASGRRTDEWTVARAALGREGSRWLPVRRPAAYAGEVFAWCAAAQGISLPRAVDMAVRPKGTVLATDRSGTLTEVLRDMLLYSTNLTAECVGLTASGEPGLGQSGAAMTEWARKALGAEGRFVDHSGLENESVTTAADMVRVLVASPGLAWGMMLPELLRDMGMRDDKGKIIEGHPVQVRAKSGTLNFVSALAGYITPPGGRRLAFAIYAADVSRRAGLGPNEMEDPEGGEAWTKRARILHGRLISRWAALYG